LACQLCRITLRIFTGRQKCAKQRLNTRRDVSRKRGSCSRPAPLWKGWKRRAGTGAKLRPNRADQTGSLISLFQRSEPWALRSFRNARARAVHTPGGCVAVTAGQFSAGLSPGRLSGARQILGVQPAQPPLTVCNSLSLSGSIGVSGPVHGPASVIRLLFTYAGSVPLPGAGVVATLV